MSKIISTTKDVWKYNIEELDSYLDGLVRALNGTCDVYVVGGAVRDTLLGKKPHDYDFVAVPREGHSIEEFEKYKTVGKNFPVVLWRYAGKTHEVAIVKNLREDLRRRDCTINAIAFSYYNHGTLIHPEGALDDINNKVIKVHGNIEKKLKEDPIRILRLLRFAAKYDFTIDMDTYCELHRLRHLIKDKSIPRDRIYHELQKGITCGNGAGFVRLLDEFELLEHFFPAVHAVKEVDGAHYHNEKVFTHILSALRAIDGINLPFELKMSALYHDVGKIQHEVTEEGKVRFVKHADVSKKLVVRDLNKLGFPKEKVAYIKTLVGEHMSFIGGRKSLMKLIIRLDRGKVPFKEFMWMKYADSKGNMRTKTDFKYFAKQYRDCLRILNPKHVPSLKDLDLNGRDLIEMGIPEGKAIGKILNVLWENFLEGRVENKKESLVTFVRRMIAQDSTYETVLSTDDWEMLMYEINKPSKVNEKLKKFLKQPNVLVDKDT